MAGNFITPRTTANSLCRDFTTIVKRFVYPSSLENVFAFRMGEVEISKKYNNNMKREQSIQQQKRELTLEQKIFNELFGQWSDEDDEDEEMHESVLRRARDLGWMKGYKIQKEFERMQFDEESW